MTQTPNLSLTNKVINSRYVMRSVLILLSRRTTRLLLRLMTTHFTPRYGVRYSTGETQEMGIVAVWHSP